MSSATLGFFVGAIPGLAYIARNMIQFQREVTASQEIVKRNEELFDFYYSHSLQFAFLWNPKSFIRGDDGPGTRAAKEHLLLVRKRTLFRHAMGGFVLFIGALVCSVVAASLWP